MHDFEWGDPRFPLTIRPRSEGASVLSISERVRPALPSRPKEQSEPAMVEILAVGEGRSSNSLRTVRTSIGDRLRYVRHETGADDSGVEWLAITQQDDEGGVSATTTISRHPGVAAYRAVTKVTNVGQQSIDLQAVTAAHLVGITDRVGQTDQLDVWSARSEWCAESRWFATDLGGAAGLVNINSKLHNHLQRGTIARSSSSTWSSGTLVPTSVLVNRDDGSALAWEVEHNGPWRWELNTLFDSADELSLALMGPTDIDHAWLKRLQPGESFTTPAVSISYSEDGLEGAIAELTKHRRQSHRFADSSTPRPLVYNDYMNALMGDPTREKLFPLIDAAAKAGAKYFCIDAGWYDDGDNWWPSVGAWRPSNTRFGPEGIEAIVASIREAGMQPGLWIEPEVIGVRSAVAQQLPDEAFMTRNGTRIVEQERYLLDFRSAHTREYLDGVFARLIEEVGARYFKWDYNVTPGAGPDRDADSVGDALREHCAALLEWVAALRERYPDVIFEACSSGAQRMDSATLQHFDLQSSSDQQDYALYPTIAAGAPMSMPFEMAGNWAYPQSEWTDEQIAFTLVTGLSGRLYLSGNIDKLNDAQFDLVSQASALYPELIEHHTRALPQWPLGLPVWDAKQVVLASASGQATYLFVWNRDPNATTCELPLHRFAGSDIEHSVEFPKQLPEWGLDWNRESGVLELNFRGTGESARVIRITQPEDSRRSRET